MNTLARFFESNIEAQDLEAETWEFRLLDAYANTDVLPNDGMIKHILDDHLIQFNMSFNLAFASMPVDKADWQPHKFGAVQGHQLLLPGHAFQLNWAKKEDY